MSACCRCSIPAGRPGCGRPRIATSGSWLAEVAEALLADAQDAPYAVYGHSFGALTAFELLHVIRSLGGPMPVRLIVSGFSAPQDEDFADDAVTDEEIIALLRQTSAARPSST